MAWRLVKQPNNLLAMWSDMVSDFTHLHLIEEEALELCLKGWDEDVSKNKVKAGMEDHIPWSTGVKVLQVVTGGTTVSLNWLTAPRVRLNLKKFWKCITGVTPPNPIRRKSYDISSCTSVCGTHSYFLQAAPIYFLYGR